ncbi:MAG: hypothetical protein ABGZ35_32680 [Planctomycetaceae bacterium]
MKCQQCSTDAPAETDPRSGRLRCPKCRAFFGTGTTQPTAVRRAQDILQKWSTADLLDQISSFPQIPPLPEPVRSAQSADQSPPNSQPPSPESPQAGPTRILRVDRNADDHQPDSAESDDEDPGDPDSTEDAPDRQIINPAALDMESVEVVDDAPDLHQASAELPPEPDIHPLSIVTADDFVQPSHPRDDESVTELAEADSADLSASARPPQTKKQKRRRLARRPATRRALPAESERSTSYQQRPQSHQQGTDAVKHNLRVDRPGDPSRAGDIVIPPEETTVPEPRAQDAPVTRRYRVDEPEPLADLTDGNGRVRGHSRTQQRYIDEPHPVAGLRGPHFEVSSPGRSSLTSLMGQFLAYIGVLGLTVGTAIVIYGHFGGYSEYTPTGWLVTTVAQMLLFLGVINLVSGGIEQNNEDVSRRINVLGEQLMRIEQVTQSAVRGPKIPVERYAGTAPAEEMSEHEPAFVNDGR